MHAGQLLEHVAPEDREEVQSLYATFLKVAGDAADERIDSFAHALHERGLLSAEGLKDFMTYHGLSLGGLEGVHGTLPATTRYELMALVGQGAMGEVFLGRDPPLRRTVAVKRVNAEMAKDEALLQRFITEAQVTAQLDHPAIVPVYGLERGADGGLAYAMKFVRGVTLTRFIEDTLAQFEERGRVDDAHSLKARIETFLPVLNAIAYAHRRGVVHRDLKPDNIMVGSFGQVLVMDWGIARLLGSADPDATSPPVEGVAAQELVPGAAGGEAGARASQARSRFGTQPKLTVAGTVLGTPAYMSPEQALSADVGPASDLFALGLILQELVTLEPARDAQTGPAMLGQALKGERAPIGDAREPIPRELRAIIARATAPQVHERYASVAALGDDLKRFLRDESVVADPDRGLRKVTRWIGKHRGLAVALGGGLAVLAFALVVFFVWQSQLAVAREREVARQRERALSALEGRVDAQAQRMSERLYRYEALLEGVVGAAALALQEPAPPSAVPVYQYREGERRPEALPPHVMPSKFYRMETSLFAGYSIAWGLDPAPLRPRIDQLARIEPRMREALLRSIGDHAFAMPFSEVQARVLERGAPLMWLYFYTEDGVGLDLPGSYEPYDTVGGTGFDNRREAWYRRGRTTRGPVWTVAPDQSELDVTLSCLMTVRDGADAVLGVAGVDVGLKRFIEELLEIPELAAVGVEALLLDERGVVLIRSSNKDHAQSGPDWVPVALEHEALRVQIGAQASGYLRVEPDRLAIWSRLGSAGLSYLVIGSETAMLGSVGADGGTVP